MPRRPKRAYVTGISEFFGIDHRFSPAAAASDGGKRRNIAASLGDLTAKRCASKRAARASPVGSAFHRLPRKSLKNRIKALSSRERLVNVQE
jgi:hypothetical protein